MKTVLRLAFSIRRMSLRFRVTSHSIGDGEIFVPQHVVEVTDLHLAHFSPQVRENTFAIVQKLIGVSQKSCSLLVH